MGVNETLTGSGSLLSTSESDTWSGRHRPPWPSADNTSPGLPPGHARRGGTSPMRRQNSSQQPSQPFLDQPSISSNYFPAPASQGLQRGPRSDMPDPNAAVLMPSRGFESNGFHRSSRHNSDDGERYAANAMAFENNDSGFSIQPQRQRSHQSASGFSSSVASRSGSIPPSRNGLDPLSRFNEASQGPSYSNVNGSGANGVGFTSKLSAQALAFSRNSHPVNHRFDDLPNSYNVNSAADQFAMLGLAKENPYAHNEFEAQMGSRFAGHGAHYDIPRQNEIPSGDMWDADENNYSTLQDPYAQHSAMPGPSQGLYRTPTFNTSYSHSTTSNDGRRNQQSPYGSGDGSSPYPLQSRAVSRTSFSGNIPAGQALMLDRKLRGLQHEQQSFMPPHLHFRHPFPNPYDYHPQHAMRMNMNPYYPVSPMANLLPPAVPRGPAKDQDAGHSTRSACLEEFRSNSKTNKRYELKVVQISADTYSPFNH